MRPPQFKLGRLILAVAACALLVEWRLIPRRIAYHSTRERAFSALAEKNDVFLRGCLSRAGVCLAWDADYPRSGWAERAAEWRREAVPFRERSAHLHRAAAYHAALRRVYKRFAWP